MIAHLDDGVPMSCGPHQSVDEILSVLADSERDAEEGKIAPMALTIDALRNRLITQEELATN